MGTSEEAKAVKSEKPSSPTQVWWLVIISLKECEVYLFWVVCESYKIYLLANNLII